MTPSAPAAFVLPAPAAARPAFAPRPHLRPHARPPPRPVPRRPPPARAPSATASTPSPTSNSNSNSTSTSTSTSAAAAPSRFATDRNVLRYISLSNNSFALRHAHTTLLVDPWLHDDLVFFTPRFFRATKPLARSPQHDFRSFDASRVDAIVLTQALPDHAHEPTLRRLPRHIPVVATPAARPLLKKLGFSNLTFTHFGQTVSPLPAVRITTLKGSVVGPPWTRPEHAYIFSFDPANPSAAPLQLYHEPHGNHDLRALAEYTHRIDVVVVPVRSVTTTFGYSIINGTQQALQLCQCLSPRTIVPFDNAGTDSASGALAAFLRSDGGVDQFQTRLAQQPYLKNSKVVFPSAIGSEYVVASRNDEPL